MSAITDNRQEIQNNCLQPEASTGEQEVVYEVAYQKIKGANYALALGAMGIGYALSCSPLAAVGIGAVALLSSAQMAVGHARLWTPGNKIGALSSCITKKRSKSEGLKNNPEKNPRILVHMKATAEQIETIESALFVPLTTCSHGACRVLARADLPHASFPRSLSPTWSAYHLAQQPGARVEYLNWRKDQVKIEPRLAAIVEVSLVSAFLGSAALSAIGHVCSYFGY